MDSDCFFLLSRAKVNLPQMFLSSQINDYGEPICKPKSRGAETPEPLSAVTLRCLRRQDLLAVELLTAYSTKLHIQRFSCAEVGSAVKPCRSSASAQTRLAWTELPNGYSASSASPLQPGSSIPVPWLSPRAVGVDHR